MFSLLWWSHVPIYTMFSHSREPINENKSRNQHGPCGRMRKCSSFWAACGLVVKRGLHWHSSPGRTVFCWASTKSPLLHCFRKGLNTESIFPWKINRIVKNKSVLWKKMLFFLHSFYSFLNILLLQNQLCAVKTHFHLNLNKHLFVKCVKND